MLRDLHPTTLKDRVLSLNPEDQALGWRLRQSHLELFWGGLALSLMTGLWLLTRSDLFGAFLLSSVLLNIPFLSWIWRHIRLRGRAWGRLSGTATLRNAPGLILLTLAAQIILTALQLMGKPADFAQFALQGAGALATQLNIIGALLWGSLLALTPERPRRRATRRTPLHLPFGRLIPVPARR